MQFPSFKKLKKRNYKKIIIRLVLVLLILCFGVFLGAVSFNKQIEQKTIIKNFGPLYRLVRKTTDLFFIFNYLIPNNFETYNLVISESDFKALNDALPQPYSEVILTEEYQIDVPATFIANGEEYKVLVRYRGDHNNHWSAPKKSWLVKFDEEKLFAGKSKLHFIIPFDRYYIVAYLNYFRSQKIGLITPQFGFANLKVNGKLNGTYFWVEGMSKELVEKNQKTGDTNLYSTVNLDWLFGEGVREFSNVTPWKKNVENPNSKYDNFAEIDKLLDLINNADEETFQNQIFNLIDKDNFFKRQVHSLLIASDHQAGANSRIYFNSTTGKFEFLTWNTDQGVPTEILDRLYDPLINRIMSRPENIHLRNQYLWDYVYDEKNLEEDLAVYDQQTKLFKVDYFKDPIRVKSYLQYLLESKKRRQWIIDQFYYLRQALMENRAFLEVRVNNETLPNGLVLDVYVDNATDLVFNGIKLRFEELPLDGLWQLYYDEDKNDGFDRSDKVLKIKSSDNDKKTITLDFDDFMLHAFRSIEPDSAFINIDPTRYRFYLTGTDIEKINRVRPNLKNYFTQKEPKEEVEGVFIDESEFSYFDQITESRGQFLARYPIFSSGGGDLVVLGPDTYHIRQNIIIPQNLKLQILAGAKLIFAPGISLVSYSPIEILGSQTNPVVVTAQNIKQPWGVFAILNNEKNRSKVEYAKFSYGGQAAINGAFFSGMLASHSSDITVKNSEFSQAIGDDSLNVKDAQAEIINNKFYQNQFDALDLDFTSGEIKNNEFTDNGNDGIDLSGGENFIFGNLIVKSGDKGISVGEESKDIIINNLIKDGIIGIAVKDLSAPQIINNTIINNQTGIASYLKKQIFGGGHSQVANCIIWGNNEQITLDQNSTIKITYSDIEGGYEGENNIDIDPASLNQKGNIEILKQYYQTNLKEVGLGVF